MKRLGLDMENSISLGEDMLGYQVGTVSVCRWSSVMSLNTMDEEYRGARCVLYGRWRMAIDHWLATLGTPSVRDSNVQERGMA